MSKASGALVASVLALAVWAGASIRASNRAAISATALSAAARWPVLTFNVTTLLALMGFAIWLAPHSGGSTNTTTDRTPHGRSRKSHVDGCR